MKSKIQNIVNAVNRVEIRLLIFSMLFLNTFSLMLNENEEEYFAFAKAFVNHNWIPGALSLKDVPGSRIIFDSIVGWVLGFASFEQVAIFGRALSALLFAFPLARIFKKLKFTNLESLFMLQLICILSHQNFFGKEWIFGSFESKVISYLFIFYSLFYLLENRFFLSVIFSGLAIYFHILVGGWYSLILFAYLLISRTPLKMILIYGLSFAALTTPMGIYLATNYLLNNPNIIGGVHISQVYVYFRNPHHLDMIKQIGHWGSSGQIGVILSLFFCTLCLRLYFKVSDPIMRKLTLLNILLFSQQFLSLLIALFDKDGGFLKFYPYRTSSLSFFLMLIIIAMLLKGPAALRSPAKAASANPSRSMVIALMIGFIALGLCFKMYKNINESCNVLFPSPEASARISLYDWIKKQTPTDSVFLDLNKGIRDDLDFVRRTDRDSFSVFKFVPTTNKLIYEWYLRVQEKQKIEKDLSYAYKVRQTYRIDFIVSKEQLTDKGLQLVYNNEYYFLYSFI